MNFFNIFKPLKKSKNKDKIIQNSISELSPPTKTNDISSSLKENISLLENLFKDDDTFVTRHIKNANNSAHFFIAYCDGVVNSQVINDYIIKPLVNSNLPGTKKSTANEIIENVVLVSEATKSNDIKKIIESITYGDTILFTEGLAEAIILNSKFFTTRSITEPDAEKILSGPREGFTEGLMTNLSLIRRKLRTNELKIKSYTLGERTKTQMCICYIDGIVNKNVLKELYKRLDKIKMDGVLDTNYITEQIRDNTYSPFRTTGYTERPDVVVAKLLEGRVALVLDGTPVVMTIPYLFVENFQSNEDYYLSYYYTSFQRILRFVSYFLTISVPAIYIGAFAFHLETMPPQLMVSIASERISVPLPAALETYLMLIVFDILKEAGMRMPSNAGQALSIVGALVIGQAAVSAKLVAAPMIIIVAIVGITNLLVPKMNASIILIRFTLLTFACIFGLTGVVLGLSALLVHLLNLESFGVPVMSSLNNFKFQDVKDTVVRSPWQTMIKRPPELADDKIRMNNDEQKF